MQNNHVPGSTWPSPKHHQKLKKDMTDTEQIAFFFAKNTWQCYFSAPNKTHLPPKPAKPRRCAFCRLLLLSPKVVILDEATSALDEATEGQLYEELLQMHSTPTVTWKKGNGQRHGMGGFLDGGWRWKFGHVGYKDLSGFDFAWAHFKGPKWPKTKMK